MVSSSKKIEVRPVLLAGGEGNRLWPVSKSNHPKQFLKFFDKQFSLFQKTILRLQGNKQTMFLSPLILTAQEYRFIVKEQLDEINIEPMAILLEPHPKNTAPSILSALLYLEREKCESLLLFLPTDHYLEDAEQLFLCINEACQHGLDKCIFTFGIKPDRPEPGYGYIKVLNSENKRIMRVNGFIEKPSLENSRLLVQKDDCLWNSGIFFVNQTVLKKSFNAEAPYLLDPIKKAIHNIKMEKPFIFLGEKFWSKSPSISIDYAVIEKISNILSIELKSKWSDMGTWEAVARDTIKDENGCSAMGSVVHRECKNSLFISDHHSIELMAYGVEDIVVISTKNEILVINKDKTNKVKDLVEELNKKRKSNILYDILYRSWGSFENIFVTKKYSVTKVRIASNKSVSFHDSFTKTLQWVVISGTAKFLIDNVSKTIFEDNSISIPKGKAFLLENKTSSWLELIEVQIGSELLDYLAKF